MSTFSDRRRFQRFGFEAQALLRIRSNSRTPCRLLDLSLNGAFLEINEPPPADIQSGKLGLVVRGLVCGDIVTMAMDIEVVRLNGRQLGCRFINVDIDSFASLKSLIEDNLGDVDLLDRELAQLDYWPGISSEDSSGA